MEDRREYHILGSRYLTLASLAYIGGTVAWYLLPPKVGGVSYPKKIPFKTHVFTYYFRYIVLTADFQTRKHNRSLFNTV